MITVVNVIPMVIIMIHVIVIDCHSHSHYQRSLPLLLLLSLSQLDGKTFALSSMGINVSRQEEEGVIGGGSLNN